MGVVREYKRAEDDIVEIVLGRWLARRGQVLPHYAQCREVGSHLDFLDAALLLEPTAKIHGNIRDHSFEVPRVVPSRFRVLLSTNLHKL